MTRLRHIATGCLVFAALGGSALAADGTITTFAGTVAGFAGDGEPATQALLDGPGGLTRLPDGSVLIADTANHRVRRVTPFGIILTVAGTGTPDYSGDDGPASGADLFAPSDVQVAPDGGWYVADTGNHRIRRVAPDGIITTVAGGPGPGFSGDGAAAVDARLNTPTELSLRPDGTLLIADTANHRVRSVSPAGVITTVAGSGAGPAFSGDGGPAIAARLSSPGAVSAMPDGSLLIADTANHRVRRVAPDGTITTVAGAGQGFRGDGEPARTALLDAPADVTAVGVNGGYVVADRANHRVRRVTPLGTIFTIAGGPQGLAGDGGPASAGLLNGPSALAGIGAGLLVADTGNARVRALSDVGQLPPPALNRSMSVTPVAGSVAVRVPTAAPVALREPDLAPNRSAVDAARGSLDMAVRDRAGGLATARVSGGTFVAEQPAAGAIVAKLHLNQPLPGCSAAARTTNAVRRTTRRLRIRVKGRYQTIGRYASAVASGTAWTMIDGCDRTVIRVTEGRVIVRNKRTGKLVVVRAGQTRTILARRS